MKITFETILKFYLVILMAISMMLITDRLTERSSKPIVVDNDLNSTILLIKKGCFFHSRYEKL